MPNDGKTLRTFDPRRGSRDNPDPTQRTRHDVVEQLSALRRACDTLGDTLRAAGATKEEVRKFAAIEAQVVLFRRDFRHPG